MCGHALAAGESGVGLFYYCSSLYRDQILVECVAGDVTLIVSTLSSPPSSLIISLKYHRRLKTIYLSFDSA